MLSPRCPRARRLRPQGTCSSIAGTSTATERPPCATSAISPHDCLRFVCRSAMAIARPNCWSASCTWDADMVDRMTRMDREADGNLLLSGLGVETNGRSRAFERLSQRDWDDVLYQSAHHRVAALLYDRLAALPTSAAIPAPVMQQLRDMALQDALSNMRLYD